MTAGSLLSVVGIARGTYHYQLNAMKRPDKDSGLLELVREAFENSKRGYGYKRVHLELKSMGIVASAKRIMRLTARHCLAPLFKSAKRHGLYKGEPAKAPKNLADRDFHAERPNRLWITDPAGFSIPAGKAYLSPVIDCHDGLPVAWRSAPARTRHWPTECSPTRAPRSGTGRSRSSIPTVAATTGGPSGSASARSMV